MGGGRQHLLYAIQFIFAWLFDHIHSLVGLHCPLLLLMSFFFFERYQTKLRNFIRYAPLTLNAISTRLAQIHTCMSIQQQGVSKSVCWCVCVCWCLVLQPCVIRIAFFQSPQFMYLFCSFTPKAGKGANILDKPGEPNMDIEAVDPYPNPYADPCPAQLVNSCGRQQRHGISIFTQRTNGQSAGALCGKTG